MSTAPAEVTPDSASLPDQGGSRLDPTTAPEKRPRRWRWMALAAVFVVVAGVILLSLRSKTPTAAGLAHPSLETPGQRLRLKGTTEAIQARAILAPLLAGQQIGTLTIIHLAPAGAKVKQGDLLVEFDRQAQMRDIVDKQADYEKLVDQ